MLKYVGRKRGWLRGVPARDLSDDEAEYYGRQRLIDTGLYAEPPDPDYDAIAEAEELADGTDEEE